MQRQREKHYGICLVRNINTVVELVKSFGNHSQRTPVTQPPTPMILFPKKSKRHGWYMYMQVDCGKTDGSSDNRTPCLPCFLRAEQLVALLTTLQALDTLAVHLFSHLLIASLLLLGCSSVLDALDMGLGGEEVLATTWKESVVSVRHWESGAGKWWECREERTSKGGNIVG